MGGLGLLVYYMWGKAAVWQLMFVVGKARVESQRSPLPSSYICSLAGRWRGRNL